MPIAPSTANRAGTAKPTAARYEHLSEAYYAAPPDPDPAQPRDTKFANGLDIVLDGLAARLPRAVGQP